jgi:hypothetical protein
MKHFWTKICVNLALATIAFEAFAADKGGRSVNIQDVLGKEKPKDKFDLMEIVKVVPREDLMYDPKIFGGDLGPSTAKQC